MLGVLAALALALAPLSVAATPRDVLSFNKAWRFHHGDPAAAPTDCPAGDFPHAIAGATCDATALTFAPLHDAEECRRACCSGLYLNESCVQVR